MRSFSEIKKNTLVLGRGFLGKAFEIQRFRVLGKDEFSIDPQDPEACLASMPDSEIVVNCIAKSNTRWCETNLEEAVFANATIPKLLSRHCQENGKQFVHISTGCLYDINTTPQQESDFLAAHCGYTVSKWIGEKFCDERDLILRPRLYFGDFKDRNNLICKLRMFTKFLTEINSFTSVHTIVSACQVLLNAEVSGVFNVACDGYATPKELSEWMGLSGESIGIEDLNKETGISLVNSTMDLQKLKKYYQPPTLKDEFTRCVARINRLDFDNEPSKVDHQSSG